MCRALMPGDEETMSDEAIWETLPVCLNFNLTFFIWNSSILLVHVTFLMLATYTRTMINEAELIQND